MPKRPHLLGWFGGKVAEGTGGHPVSRDGKMCRVCGTCVTGEKGKEKKMEYGTWENRGTGPDPKGPKKKGLGNGQGRGGEMPWG